MPMHNPPHPGEFIREVYLEPNGITGRQLAAKLCVSPSTLNRILQGTSGISPEMALRLSKALGRSPESWLAMQDNHDLWQARQTVDLDTVQHIDFAGGATKPPKQKPIGG
jgi:addiction module HigA family antidote